MFETLFGLSTASNESVSRPLGNSEFELPQPDRRGHLVDSILVGLALGDATLLEALDLTGLLLTVLSEPGVSHVIPKFDRA